MDILEGVGFDPDGWRLDVAPHPFAQRIAPGDVRITTRYDLHDFTGAYFGALHEFGHGLYEAGIPEALARSPLGSPVSLGVHESQSRLWENLVGRCRPFCAWALPRLAEHLPGRLDGTTVDELYRGVNTVHRSLIRVEADETTYNLHIVLRFELELALIEGTLRGRRPPARLERGHPPPARPRRARRRPGRAPGRPLGRRADRLLPDLHARQPDGGPAVGDAARRAARARRADRARRLRPAARRGCASASTCTAASSRRPSCSTRVTGQELAVAPFLRYLREKLADAGVLTAAPR